MAEVSQSDEAHIQRNEFLIARSLAIQSYANVEQSLCDLFAHLSDTTLIVAGAIFFRMSNSASRLALLDRLMRMKYQDKHRLFFNSLISALKPLDGARNEIVHWHMAVDIMQEGHGDIFVGNTTLTPPNFWARDDNTPEWNTESLNKFEDKCRFMFQVIMGLSDLLRGRFVPLPDIYDQPLSYPPPPDHPAAPIHINIEAQRTALRS